MPDKKHLSGTKKTHLGLGLMLILQKTISAEQLADALNKQFTSLGHRRIGEILVRLKYTDKKTVNLALSKQLGIEYVESVDQVPQEVLELVDKSIAMLYRVMPIRVDGNKLVCLTNDPCNEANRDNLSRLLDRPVDFVIGDPDIIERYFDPNQDKASEFRLPDMHPAILDDKDDRIIELSAAIQGLKNEIAELRKEVQKLSFRTGSYGGGEDRQLPIAPPDDKTLYKR